METVAVRRGRSGWVLDPRWEAVRREPCYLHFMDRLNPISRSRYETSFRGFMRWLWDRQQREIAMARNDSTYHSMLPAELLEVKTATQLLTFQKKLNSMSMQDESAEYLLLDLIEAHVQEKAGTTVGMVNRLS